MRHEPSTYRLLASVLAVAAAVFCVFPLKDRQFDKYIVNCATTNKQELESIINRANERVTSGQSRTLYLGIRDIADSEKIDLSKFFPKKNIADIKSIQKKNRILLDALLSESKCKIKQGLDLKGGVSFVLKIDDSGNVNGKRFSQLSALEKNEQLNKAIDIIRQRIDGLGVSEPAIRIFGGDAIEIQLPGISTANNPEIVDVIKKPAKLEFKLLSNTAVPMSRADTPPSGYEILAFENDDDGIERLAFVKKIPEMTGKMVDQAYVQSGQYGDYSVALSMTEEGKKRFEKITANNIGRQLGIVLDGKLCSAPVIQNVISEGNAVITGKFSQRQAFELKNVLNNPLEVELKLAEINEIGPSLAGDARTTSLKAAAVGAGIVMMFLVAYYHVAGLISVLSVIANVIIVFGAMVAIGATLTLPGIAALVLTIGMSIDANILIFERMREEILAGSPVDRALFLGHDRAFWTILDSNLTTLLTACILIFFGTGAIKGFGVILAIGILSTVFCALVMNRGLLEAIVEKKLTKTLLPNFRISPKKFDYLKHTKAVFIGYSALILIGAVIISKRERIYGIDFTGGDEITVKFEKKIPANAINNLAKKTGVGEVTSVYQKSASDNSEILRIQTEESKGAHFFDSMKSEFKENGLSLQRSTTIGGTVGSNIKLNAVTSVALSMIGIMLYVAFRFELGYGIGAVVSTITDVIATLVIYLVLGHQISAATVAAILMVVGYAINDTIIVFDRIREELKNNPSLSLKQVINLSITRTLSRTLLTSVSTLFAALSLYLFGSGVVTDFALVFLIGVIVGTFSSIFIASPIFYMWNNRQIRPLQSANSKAVG